jgi:hypothetical protein
VDEPHLTIPITISPPEVSNDHVKMDLTFEKTTILLHFDKSPIARLYESDARNLLNLLPCPLPVLTVLVGEEFFPNDMMKKDQTLPPIAKTQELVAIHAPVLGQNYVLAPVVTDFAWGLKAERQKREPK